MTRLVNKTNEHGEIEFNVPFESSAYETLLRVMEELEQWGVNGFVYGKKDRDVPYIGLRIFAKSEEDVEKRLEEMERYLGVKVRKTVEGEEQAIGRVWYTTNEQGDLLNLT